MIIDDIKKIYPEFEYPNSYISIKNLNLIDYGIWYIMPDNQIINRIIGLQNRYPYRFLVPFARRDDCDDIACFDVSNKNTVQIIHDYAGSGYELREEYSDFWEWFRYAINVMILASSDYDNYNNF